jgi:hypothetical protein
MQQCEDACSFAVAAIIRSGSPDYSETHNAFTGASRAVLWWERGAGGGSLIRDSAGETGAGPSLC